MLPMLDCDPGRLVNSFIAIPPGIDSDSKNEKKKAKTGQGYQIRSRSVSFVDALRRRSMMSTFHCPACGVSLLAGSEKCSACSVDIDWQGGQPVVTTEGRSLSRVAIVILIAVLAAGAVLAAVVMVLANA